MELRHLRYFVAVAEEENVHRAAKRLHISQPPLSLSIKQLEAEIGTDLFTRQGRSIQITRAGTAFLVSARKILQAAEAAKADARLIGAGKQGTLKLGFISSAVTGILQDTIAGFKLKAPDAVLEISQAVNGQLGDEVMAGDYDAAIIRWPEYLPAEIVTHKLTKDSWAVACPATHPFAKLAQVTLKALAAESLIFYPRYNNPGGHDDVMTLFHDRHLKPDIVQEAPEQMTIAGLVAGGFGLGIVPACMANIPVPGLVHRPLAGTAGRTGFALIHRKSDDALLATLIRAAKRPK